MKINFTAITAIMFFSFCLPAVAFSQQARLEGNIYEIANSREIPVAGVRVIAPGGQSKETDSKGHFVIDFPNSVQPGQAARIEVNRPGWLVRDPLFGECATQNPARNFEFLKVIIVPKGSPLALEPRQLSKVVARWADERAKLRGRVTELEQQLDEYAFLREYAEKYGFTLDQFKIAADEWAKIKESDDKEERALKEYWLKNYDSAAALFREAGDGAVRELGSINEKRLTLGRQAIRRYRGEGNSWYAQYKFREALIAYNKIDTLFSTRELSKEDLPEEWAEAKQLLGSVKWELGTIVEGPDSKKLLSESVFELRQAMNVYTREHRPRQWAAVQNNLGIALMRQGERAEGAESIRLLGDAVRAFRVALEVRTYEQSPQDWAVTQSNLGIALIRQGERAEGAESVRLIGDAVQAYREAAKVKAYGQSPWSWGVTQINLGIALMKQGEQKEGEGGGRLLDESVATLREALKIFTREKDLYLAAETQNIIGIALTKQGQRTQGVEGVRLLDEAVATLHETLKVRTREQAPQAWAKTQNDLGVALSAQGERVEGTNRMQLRMEAISVFYKALEVETRKQLPQQWAATKSNLCAALTKLGEVTESVERTRLLREAVATCRESIEVRTREHLPQDWAVTQNSLGQALTRLGELTEGSEGMRLLDEAVTAYRFALTVFTREHLPQRWAATQDNLGNALRLQGEYGVRRLQEAAIAYRDALKVRTREHMPQQWFMTQTNLAGAYFLLGDWAKAAESYAKSLTLSPNNALYNLVSGLYHDKLFKFEVAFTLNQQWLARYPGDLLAQANFAERHFTTGRFDECLQRIGDLLTKPEISVNFRPAMRAVEIAALLALDQSDRVPAKMDALLAEISHQPAAFKVDWVFDGTKYFISQNVKLSPYRAWLGQLFGALEGNDGATILKGLQEVKESFKAR